LHTKIKKKKRILVLILDDSITQLTELKYILEANDFMVVSYKNPINALDYLNDKKSILPDAIISDIIMPEMDGFDFCRHVKSNLDIKDIPFIFLTSLGDNLNHKKGLELGAVDYINKPMDPDLIIARLNTNIDLEQHRSHLEDIIDEKTEELEKLQQITIECIATLAEYRDNETGTHIHRTQEYIRLLANEMQKTSKYKKLLTKKCIKLLYQSAPLHDIGKIGIPDSILLKPGRLTEEEFEVMKTHTDIGRKALELADKRMGKESFLHHAAELAGYHHERWDGNGYPKGLKGEDIPFFARMMAIVDVYDALVSKRVYKDPISHHEAIKIIKSETGTHFDSEMVNAFLRVEKECKEVVEKYSDSKPDEII
jgi:putative two-component system response regulator